MSLKKVLFNAVTLCLYICLCCGLYSPAYAIDLIQNPSARSHTNLNGAWSIIVDPYENGFYNHRYEEHGNGYFKNAKTKKPSDLIEYNFETSDKLQVPGDWNTQRQELFLYEGTIWYQRDFTLQKKTSKRYVLYFDAVNYKATVYLNGVKLGEHEGGFTPFQFDIDSALMSGNNSVVVKVDNRRERNQIPTVNTDWWNYGGITRPVKVLALDKELISDYNFDYRDNTLHFSAMVDKSHSTNSPSKVELMVSIPELKYKKVFTIDRSGSVNAKLNVKPELWSPESPKLYDIELSLVEKSTAERSTSGTVTGTVSDKIGFRSITVQGDEIFLNGESIFMRGISIHEESPRGDGRAWSEDDARTLLQWAKDLGCNFVRLAHYPHNENMLRMADEMGLMVWSEIPVYWTVLFEQEEVYNKAEQQLSEMISRDKNRASIILWSVANETPNHKARYRFLERLIKRTRELDSSRLVTAAMDTQGSNKYGKVIDDPLVKVVDVIGVNSYCGWYADTPESCADMKWQSSANKPVIISEFGAGALFGAHGSDQQRFTEENQALVYTNNLKMLDNMPFLRGVSPWILKDFRSPRRPLPNIQDFWNRKGLLSENGQKKQAWYVLREWYAKKAEK
ncbi:MAG: beta-glucuronidase [Flavobacteriales bacterium]|jgi:beta-glucuronidase